MSRYDLIWELSLWEHRLLLKGLERPTIQYSMPCIDKWKLGDCVHCGAVFSVIPMLSKDKNIMRTITKDRCTCCGAVK